LDAVLAATVASLDVVLLLKAVVEFALTGRFKCPIYGQSLPAVGKCPVIGDGSTSSASFLGFWGRRYERSSFLFPACLI
jgi:hypothetical protein